MPLGIHFMANWVQGSLLGFGVCGTAPSGFSTPVIREAPNWLPGGAFGLEASIPGLICMVVALILLFQWKQKYGT